tara:strand:- start:15 stop:518 length:504 start_codon:yes stop_codon:yes gene_type:complete
MVQETERLEDYLYSNYVYCPLQGFIERDVDHGRWKVGTVVGECVGKRGYKTISILGKRYFTHRILYWYYHKEWPELIDHIDGDKTNNREDNLRESSKVSNALNLKTCHRDNKSGFLGVTYRRDTGRYSARFRNKNIGCFDTPQEAHEAYVNFKRDATATQRGTSSTV